MPSYGGGRDAQESAPARRTEVLGGDVDRDEYEQTWCQRRDVAVRAANRVLPGQREAEDCAHDALVDVLVKKPAFEGVDRPDAWLTTLAYRRAVDMVRHERRSQAASFVRVLPDERLVPEVADVVADRLAAQTLMEDLARLPESTQAVLHQGGAGLSTAEAAVELGAWV